MNTNEVGWVYNTVFSIPGMNEQVKLDVKTTRKTVLLLSNVIERGLKSESKEGEKGLAEMVSPENLEELKKFAEECLDRAGLTDLSNQMKQIPTGK